MPLNSQQGESSVRSHAGGKIIVWENCWELCRKSKKVPQTVFYAGAMAFKRNEGWNWCFLLQIEPCLNCRGAQAQSACSTDFSLRPPLIWALASRRRPAGLSEQPCQLGLSRAQIFSVINGSFQWPSVTGRYCQMETSQVELSSLGLWFCLGVPVRRMRA